jgi:hypothetical protein
MRCWRLAIAHVDVSRQSFCYKLQSKRPCAPKGISPLEHKNGQTFFESSPRFPCTLVARFSASHGSKARALAHLRRSWHRVQSRRREATGRSRRACKCRMRATSGGSHCSVALHGLRKARTTLARRAELGVWLQQANRAACRRAHTLLTFSARRDPCVSDRCRHRSGAMPWAVEGSTSVAGKWPECWDSMTISGCCTKLICTPGAPQSKATPLAASGADSLLVMLSLRVLMLDNRVRGTNALSAALLALVVHAENIMCTDQQQQQHRRRACRRLDASCAPWRLHASCSSKKISCFVAMNASRFAASM